MRIGSKRYTLLYQQYIFNIFGCSSIRLYDFFQHAAEVEKKQNASEVQKSMGSVIQYGITIQVSPSNFFLKIQLASIGF